jgi:hypothetical protein
MNKIVFFENYKINEEGATGSGDAAAGGGGGGTSYATLANTPSMGAIIAPQPGSVVGQVSGAGSGTKGSGDRVAGPFNPFTKETKKQKKSPKNKSGRSQITGKTVDEKSTMYVTKFTDWVGTGN